MRAPVHTPNSAGSSPTLELTLRLPKKFCSRESLGILSFLAWSIISLMSFSCMDGQSRHAEFCRLYRAPRTSDWLIRSHSQQHGDLSISGKAILYQTDITTSRPRCWPMSPQI